MENSSCLPRLDWWPAYAIGVMSLCCLGAIALVRDGTYGSWAFLFLEQIRVVLGDPGDASLR
jgi:hypothetical protein